jgi:hypothetical protein
MDRSDDLDEAHSDPLAPIAATVTDSCSYNCNNHSGPRPPREVLRLQRGGELPDLIRQGVPQVGHVPHGGGG